MDSERVTGRRKLSNAPALNGISDMVAAFNKSPLDSKLDAYHEMLRQRRFELGQLALTKATWEGEVLQKWQDYARSKDARQWAREEVPSAGQLTEQQEHAFASWMYWTLSNETKIGREEGRTFKYLGEVLGLSYVNHLHGMYVPLKIALPCPACDQPATFLVRSIRYTAGSIECSCPACGHRDKVSPGEHVGRDPEAVRMTCSCRHCAGDRDRLAAGARERGQRLVADMVAWLKCANEGGYGDDDTDWDIAYYARARTALRIGIRAPDLVVEMEEGEGSAQERRYSPAFENAGLREGWMVLTDRGSLVDDETLTQQVRAYLLRHRRQRPGLPSTVDLDGLFADGSTSTLLAYMDDLCQLVRWRSRLDAGWTYGVRRLELGGKATQRVAYVQKGAEHRRVESEAFDKLASLVRPKKLVHRGEEIAAAFKDEALLDRHLVALEERIESADPGAVRRLVNAVEAGLPSKPPKLTSMVAEGAASAASRYLYWKFCAATRKGKPILTQTKHKSMCSGIEEAQEDDPHVQLPCGRCGQQAAVQVRSVSGLWDGGEVSARMSCQHCGHEDKGYSWRWDSLCTCNGCLAVGRGYPAEVEEFRRSLVSEVASRMRMLFSEAMGRGPVPREFGLTYNDFHNRQSEVSKGTLERALAAVSGSKSEDIVATIEGSLGATDGREDGGIGMRVLQHLVQAGVLRVRTSVPAAELDDERLFLYAVQRSGSPRQRLPALLGDEVVPAQLVLNEAEKVLSGLKGTPFVVVHHLERITSEQQGAAEAAVREVDGESEQVAAEQGANQFDDTAESGGAVSAPVRATNPAVADAIKLLRQHGYLVFKKGR